MTYIPPSAADPVRLRGLATAVPDHELPQDLVLHNARRILGPRFPQFERMAATFETAGVERRYSFAPFEWFENDQGWASRNATYEEGGAELFARVADDALKAANLSGDEVDTVVTVSSTGIATPTFEARALRRLGFREDVMRVPVFGLGCAGGVTGLSLACRLATALPGSKVLLVVLEACTLSFRANQLRKADIVATVLFGDGAAAAVVSTEGEDDALAFGMGQEETWPDSLDIMGWAVDDEGLGVIFDRSIPAFATDHFRGAADRALARCGTDVAGVDRFVCHPGGAKVLTALEGALELADGTLDSERAVLRDYGNMSAPTALFVLDHVLRSGDRSGAMALCALGPGFTASFLPMHVPAR